MKIFTRTRKIFVLFAILLFLSIPILSEGMPYWILPRKESTQSTTSATSLPPRIATAVPQNSADTIYDSLEMTGSCSLAPRIYKMILNTITKEEKACIQFLFNNIKSKHKSVITPIIREFVHRFEIYSVKDECEFSILRALIDFGDIEIYPVTMNRFNVVLGEEKFTLERNNLTEHFIAKYTGKEIPSTRPNPLAEKVRHNYSDIVQYVGVLFLEGENKTPVGGEWILYNQDSSLTTTTRKTTSPLSF